MKSKNILYIALALSVILFAIFTYHIKTKMPSDSRLEKHQYIAIKIKNDFNKIELALELYALNNYKFPTNEEGIPALLKKSTNDEISLLNTIPIDPWNNTYQYSTLSQGNGYKIETLGSDAKPGGSGLAKDVARTYSHPSKH